KAAARRERSASTRWTARSRALEPTWGTFARAASYSGALDAKGRSRRPQSAPFLRRISPRGTGLHAANSVLASRVCLKWVAFRIEAHAPRLRNAAPTNSVGPADARAPRDGRVRAGPRAAGVGRGRSPSRGRGSGRRAGRTLDRASRRAGRAHRGDRRLVRHH